MAWQNIPTNEAELKSFDKYFHKEAKFYADEDIETVIIELLRDLGFKVQTAAEVGLVGRDDTNHIAYAFRNDRILLTRDKDYLNDRKHPNHRNPGVVVLDIEPMTREGLTNVLFLLKTFVRPYREIWRQSKILISRDSYITVWEKDHKTGKQQKTRYRLGPHREAQEWVQ
jgi:predicted nuclease of predicted toxin-antitoxin system